MILLKHHHEILWEKNIQKSTKIFYWKYLNYREHVNAMFQKVEGKENKRVAVPLPSPSAAQQLLSMELIWRWQRVLDNKFTSTPRKSGGQSPSPAAFYLFFFFHVNYTTSSCINYTQTLSIMILHIYSYLYHGYDWSMQMLATRLYTTTHMCMPSNSCSISKRSPEEPWFASKKGGARSRHKSHNARTRTCDSMCTAS